MHAENTIYLKRAKCMSSESQPALLGKLRYYLVKSWTPAVTQQKERKSFRNTESELRAVSILLERRG